MIQEHILLGCTTAHSDKQYKIVLSQADTGSCNVVGLYGKRGRLCSQNNIAIGVPASVAINAAEKMLASKLAKGYVIEGKSSRWHDCRSAFGVPMPEKPEPTPTSMIAVSRALADVQEQVIWF